MLETIKCGNCGHEGQIDFKPPINFVKCSECGGAGFRAESAEIAALFSEKIKKDGWPVEKTA